MIPHPKQFFLVSGGSDGETPLNAFDRSLIVSGVGDLNLVRMSSILPPGCTQCEPFTISPGTLIPVAYADITSSKVGTILATAVAVGIPVDKSQVGLIMEYHNSFDIEDITQNPYLEDLTNLDWGQKIKVYQNWDNLDWDQKTKRIEARITSIITEMVLSGMRYRNREVEKVLTQLNTHSVQNIAGASFSGLVLVP
jgi:pyruvoyl-dependent arginine decarboxylase